MAGFAVLSPLGCLVLLLELNWGADVGAGDPNSLDSALFTFPLFSFLTEDADSSLSVGVAREDFVGRKEVRARRLLLAPEPFETSRMLDLRLASELGPSRLRGR